MRGVGGRLPAAGGGPRAGVVGGRRAAVMRRLALARTLLRTYRRRPTRSDRAALGLWLLSRVAVFAVAAASGWLFAPGRDVVGFVSRWERWDVVHFRTIAQFGYDGDPRTGPLVPLEAFFPGLPLLLRAVHGLGLGYVAAGLAVSFVAGTVAVVALSRLGEQEGPRETGPRAVLLLVLAPPAVFLAAGYTEAVFLACALPAWLAARRGAWWPAGLLAAGAAATRVSGLFLAAALAVEFLTARGGRRRWSQAPALLVPLLPPLAYMAWLRVTRGSWTVWVEAQERGWFRRWTDPVEAFATTWDAAFGGSQPPGFAWMFRVEIVAVAVGLALTLVLLRRRRWGEATYVGLSLAALATSTWYFSVPRAALLWWPLWILLARATLAHRWLLMAYLTVVAPFAVVYVVLFTTGRWAG